MTSSSTPTEPHAAPEGEQGLSIIDLEQVYEDLAQAIDEAGSEQAERFLVKLALLNAHALGNVQTFKAQLRSALDDL
jgi:non-ribosomal peptide synthetase component E (peptide arylation enzyme)